MIRKFQERVRSLWRTFIAYYSSRSLAGKLLLPVAGVATLIIGGVILLFIMVWSGLLGPLPGHEELQQVENPVASEVYSADSVLLGRYFVQERSDVSYNQLPPNLIKALIATEDTRFYQHGGIDTKSFFRVLVKSLLLQQEGSGGGSTITQQLAKNLYPRKRYVFLSLPINKIREMIVARRLEALYDKPALLTLYLNTIPFGDNTYGIEAAAQRFFSIPARSLSVEQGAVLVGMLKATYGYNPRLFPERALRRRNTVLAQMNKYGHLSNDSLELLKGRPLELQYNRITHHSGLAPYFREHIRQELVAWCKAHQRKDGTPYNLYTDGLKIYTTIDSRMQQYAEEAVRIEMAGIQEKFDAHWRKSDPWKASPAVVTDAVKRSERYQRLREQNVSEDEIRRIMETPVPMTIFTQHGEKEVTMSPLDSIKHYLRFLNAGVLAVEPQTGAVRVWVGGINHNFFQYDHVKQSTQRQVGSTFKPIVYAAALEQGMSPCDYTSAEKTVYTNMDEWTPENTEENYDLKFSMEGALAYSVNTVSVKILERGGIQNTIALARRMGVSGELPAVPSLALGVADLSMTEMVRAYACFANAGKAVTLSYLTAITDHNGKPLEVFKAAAKGEQALSPTTAALMVRMLKRTVDQGTASGMRTRYGVHNDMAGKTGTTQGNADGWFMGITPNLVMGAWVGSDDPRIRFRTTALGQGARTALPIVAQFFKQANSDESLSRYTQAHFAALPPGAEGKLGCDLYRSDKTFLQKIFGKKEKENRQNFGDSPKQKKGFLKRLFSKP